MMNQNEISKENMKIIQPLLFEQYARKSSETVFPDVKAIYGQLPECSGMSYEACDWIVHLLCNLDLYRIDDSDSIEYDQMDYESAQHMMALQKIHYGLHQEAVDLYERRNNLELEARNVQTRYYAEYAEELEEERTLQTRQTCYDYAVQLILSQEHLSSQDVVALVEQKEKELEKDLVQFTNDLNDAEASIRVFPEDASVADIEKLAKQKKTGDGVL